ncbi:O-methyltransferase [Rasiella rasia]|nr:class I SAM-dependent methyltransferase [Rasiella rasia]
MTKCFYNKSSHVDYQLLNTHRKALLSDTSEIAITDFGAGSRVFKSPIRKVSGIAKHAGITRKRQQLLFRLAAYFKPETILELGTSLGMGSIALALGAPTSKVITVEGCEATSVKAQQYFDEFCIKNIQRTTATFESFFAENLKETYNLVYIDGNHNKKATLSYFEALLSHVTNDTVLIFDDIYWSREMTEAWLEIIANPKVTVSIDTFQWGFVFFRREQPKQHFVIRT